MAKPTTDQLGTNFERWTHKVVEKIEGRPVERYYDKYNQIHTSDNDALKEIKYDGGVKSKWNPDGSSNVYIESKERRVHNTGPMIDSGIMKHCKSKTYFIGNGEFAYDFDKERLKEIIKENRKGNDTTYREFPYVDAKTNGVITSKGYLIPTWVADKICIRKVYFRDSVMGEDGLLQGIAEIDRIVPTPVEEERAVLFQ